MLGATVKNLIAQVTWRPGFDHTYHQNVGRWTLPVGEFLE
jgi:hypothetical protein